MPYRLITLGSVLVALLSLTLWATEKHTGHNPNMNHGGMSGDHALPQEGGQAAFSALIEIVAMLEQDAETDWEKVDIDGLRAHLLDMNHMMLNTEATSTVTEGGQVQFDIQGNAASIASIHRMVPAHASYIEQSRGWEIAHELQDMGATLTIKANEEAPISQLKALGFYGFMSLDSHHQAHHIQMAKGHSH